jgi:hypothetical protein
MSLAIASNRRRRKIVLGALTVLLHLLVLDWFSGQMGRPRERAAAARGGRDGSAAAQDAQAAAQAQAQPLPPQPGLAPPPLPQLPPEPVEVAQAEAIRRQGRRRRRRWHRGRPCPMQRRIPTAAGQGSAANAAAGVQSPQAGRRRSRPPNSRHSPT